MKVYRYRSIWTDLPDVGGDSQWRGPTEEFVGWMQNMFIMFPDKLVRIMVTDPNGNEYRVCGAKS